MDNLRLECLKLAKDGNQNASAEEICQSAQLFYTFVSCREPDGPLQNGRLNSASRSRGIQRKCRKPTSASGDRQVHSY
jgi:hypothetical protein